MLGDHMLGDHGLCDYESSNPIYFSMIYFGAFLLKRVRRFDPSSTGLDHVLVSRVLPQISAE